MKPLQLVSDTTQLYLYLQLHQGLSSVETFLIRIISGNFLFHTSGSGGSCRSTICTASHNNQEVWGCFFLCLFVFLSDYLCLPPYTPLTLYYFSLQRTAQGRGRKGCPYAISSKLEGSTTKSVPRDSPSFRTSSLGWGFLEDQGAQSQNNVSFKDQRNQSKLTSNLQ